MNAAPTSLGFSKVVSLIREEDGIGRVLTFKHGQLASAVGMLKSGEKVIVHGHLLPRTAAKHLAALSAMGLVQAEVLIDEEENLGSTKPVTLRNFRILFTKE